MTERLARRAQQLRECAQAARKCGRGVATEALQQLTAEATWNTAEEVAAAAERVPQAGEGCRNAWMTAGGLVDMSGVGEVAYATALMFSRPVSRMGELATLMPRIDWHEAFAAGGASTRALLPQEVVDERASEWGQSDLDLWVRSGTAREAAVLATTTWAEERGEEAEVTVLGFVTKIKGGDWAVDVIQVSGGIEPSALVEGFDIPACKTWMVMRGSTLAIYVPPGVGNCEVQVCPVCDIFSASTNRTVVRMLKYCRRGFSLAPWYRLCDECADQTRANWVTTPLTENRVPGRMVAAQFMSGGTRRLQELLGFRMKPQKNRLPLTESEREYVNMLMREYAAACDAAQKAERTAAGERAQEVRARAIEIGKRWRDCIQAARAGAPFPPEPEGQEVIPLEEEGHLLDKVETNVLEQLQLKGRAACEKKTEAKLAETYEAFAEEWDEPSW